MIGRYRGSKLAVVALARRIDVIQHCMRVEDADFLVEGLAPTVV